MNGCSLPRLTLFYKTVHECKSKGHAEWTRKRYEKYCSHYMRKKKEREHQKCRHLRTWRYHLIVKTCTCRSIGSLFLLVCLDNLNALNACTFNMHGIIKLMIWGKINVFLHVFFQLIWFDMVITVEIMHRCAKMCKDV